MTGAVQCARPIPNILIINAIRVSSATNGVAGEITHSVNSGAWISECEIDVAIYVFASFLKISLQLHKLILKTMLEVCGLGSQR